MKKHIIFISVMLLGILQVLYAQQETEQVVSLKQFEDSLKAGISERRLLFLKQAYIGQLEEPNAKLYQDSVMNSQILKRYPKGDMAAQKALTDFYHAHFNRETKIVRFSLQELDSVTSSFPGRDFLDKTSPVYTSYSSMLTRVLPELFESDSVRTAAITARLEPFRLRNIAQGLVDQDKHLACAFYLSKQALDRFEEANNNEGIEYALSASTHALVLEKLGKKEDALAYAERAYHIMKGRHPDINTVYITLLNVNGDNEKALRTGRELYLKQAGNDALLAQLKVAYEQTHGSEDTEAYFSALEKEKYQQGKESLQSRMLDRSAPDFSLMDLQGNTVSLSALKGKIVVLDFWAMWCGPCIASFPGMQLAVDKYQHRDDVVFLFINTWERGASKKRAGQVADFMEKNKYRFTVLLDKETAGQNIDYEVVKSYGVSGIPAKFIIGKDGHIKFDLGGFSGNDQAVLEEISSAIELLDAEK